MSELFARARRNLDWDGPATEAVSECINLLTCPVCGKKPELTKFPKNDELFISHKCKGGCYILVELSSFADADTITKKWNTWAS